MRRFMCCLLLALPADLTAQGDCLPPDDSNEAKVFATFAVPFAFGPAGAPTASRGWRARFAMEVSSIPNVDDETATPTVCRPGKGPENTDFASILPRPRVGLESPSGFSVELGWVPPVGVNGATPHLFGFSVGKTMAIGGTTLALRLHATAGRIRAPITCDKPALEDPQSECFGGTESEDTFRPTAFGTDLTAGWNFSNGRLRPFVGTGVNLLRPRFQVHFVNQQGQLDDRRVTVNLARMVVFAGGTWAPAQHFGVTGQLYAAPADAVTGRLVVSYSP